MSLAGTHRKSGATAIAAAMIAFVSAVASLPLPAREQLVAYYSHFYGEGSAGDGRHRGGLGAELVLKLETDGPAVANTAGDGVHHGAAGMLGGKDGAPHHYTLARADGTSRDLGTKEVGIPLAPGDTLHVRAGGGGGWGPPEKRDAEARRRDAAEGLL